MYSVVRCYTVQNGWTGGSLRISLFITLNFLLLFTPSLVNNGVGARALGGGTGLSLAHLEDMHEQAPEITDLDQINEGLQHNLPKTIPSSISEFLKGQGADVGEYGNFFEGDLLLPLPKLTPTGVLDESSLWPDNKVKYKLADHIVEKNREKIRQALKDIERETCVEFEEIASTVRKQPAKPKASKGLKKKGNKKKKKKRKYKKYVRTPKTTTIKTTTTTTTTTTQAPKNRDDSDDDDEDEENDGDGDYVFVTTNQKGCYTNVGRLGGKQEMNLSAKGCLAKGTIIHEFMHALGYGHEQSRPDRDTYVTIDFNNIADQYKGNFARSEFNPMQLIGHPYDYYSILHYGPYSFAIDRSQETIHTKLPGVIIGQRIGLSDQDIRKIMEVYKCEGDGDGDGDGDSDRRRRKRK